MPSRCANEAERNRLIVAEYYLAEKNIKAIAYDYDLTPQMVRFILRKAGVLKKKWYKEEKVYGKRPSADI